MAERKYNLTLGELIDRLAICALKFAKIPEHKEEYGKEIDDLIYDINICLPKGPTPGITGEFIYDTIINAQYNAHIFANEGHVRASEGKDLTDAEYAEIGKKLMLTHSLNGCRSTSKNRLNKIIGGRMDYKVDCLAADAEIWRPHGY